MVIHYQALLDRMAISDMPETAQYRMDTEKIARYRIKMAMDHPEDPDMVEDLCQCGQVEELVEQAKDEMTVLDMYLQTRMWELVADQEEIEVEYNPDPANDEEGLDEEDLGK
jgi:NADH dehydrogenase (ubiquinone) 1 alpha subcomplex subunit 5